MFLSTTQYVYNQLIYLTSYNLIINYIHQYKNTDVVITTPGALGLWSHIDQFFMFGLEFSYLKKKPPFLFNSYQKLLTS